MIAVADPVEVAGDKNENEIRYIENKKTAGDIT
jgi:hypothetical protein